VDRDKEERAVTVGFIGLGNMGRGMAASLRAAGVKLVVTDLARDAASDLLDAGATWAESARDVAEVAEVVFSSLPTPADVEAVANGPQGLRAGFRRGSAWFDLSTNAVDVVRRMHHDLVQQNVDFLDAPVSGGPAGAASGTLAIWVGGEEAVFNRHRLLLDAMADKPKYIGPSGAGTIAKLVHNMGSAAINAIIGEVLTMGVKAGLEPLPLWAAIRQGGAGRTRSFDAVGKRFLQGRFDPPSFQLRLAHKDVRLALELASQLDVPMPLCELVLDEITEAVDRGWGARDSQSFLLLQQERAAIPPFALTEAQVKTVVERD
jgi:3-hydroxyisobutyrate dehydrogenase